MCFSITTNADTSAWAAELTAAHAKRYGLPCAARSAGRVQHGNPEPDSNLYSLWLHYHGGQKADQPNLRTLRALVRVPGEWHLLRLRRQAILSRLRLPHFSMNISIAQSKGWVVVLWKEAHLFYCCYCGHFCAGSVAPSAVVSQAARESGACCRCSPFALGRRVCRVCRSSFDPDPSLG